MWHNHSSFLISSLICVIVRALSELLLSFFLKFYIKSESFKSNEMPVYGILLCVYAFEKAYLQYIFTWQWHLNRNCRSFPSMRRSLRTVSSTSLVSAYHCFHFNVPNLWHKSSDEWISFIIIFRCDYIILAMSAL